MSDGMDGRDSYAEEEQASLDQVALANTFFFTVCLPGSQMGVSCLPYKTTNECQNVETSAGNCQESCR